jgi:crotonobetainyl-CoA:carnitine CoA-transferase CaiB-like acyl-CoA transferase
MNTDYPIAHELFAELWRGLGGDEVWLDRVRFHGDGALPSAFAVTDFAAATFAAAGAAVGELLEAAGGQPSVIDVDRVLASGWFQIFPMPPSRLLPGFHQPAQGEGPIPSEPGQWMTEFETGDGRWLRIQSSWPTLQKRLAKALGTSVDVSEVAAAVRKHPGEEIEQKLVDAHATVALSRTIDEWLTHPAGTAAHAEPIVHVEAGGADGSSWEPAPGRPLAGIKVLDSTRVVAGPTGTRFLAACGAEVMRLDAPGSDESSGAAARVPNDLMLGKRWAFLDLRRPEGKARFLELLSQADIFVHTYRPEGIDELVPVEDRQRANPDMVEVGLRAYGWSGPWQLRRGFDTLVQFSSGLAAATQAWALKKPETRLPLVALGRMVDASRPRHLPVEALDLGAGYLIAAAAIRGLTRRMTTGKGSVSRLSLARTAAILTDKGEVPEQDPVIKLLDGENLNGPWEDRVYSSGIGPVTHLRFPVEIERNPLFWEHRADLPGASNPKWVTLVATRPRRG